MSPSDEGDPQRDRVYAMEGDDLRGHVRHRLPIKLIRRYARRLCRMYGVPVPTFRVYRKKGQGGECDQGRIQLDPKCGMNGLTLAHELAHHICDVKHPRAQPHGPLFVRYYGCLLTSLRLVPISGFKEICRRHKVKIARMWPEVDVPRDGAAKIATPPPRD